MTVRIEHGDSRDVVKTLADGSVDAVCTDPPYGIEFMGRAWDAANTTAFDPAFWAGILRVLKPGGYLAAFGGCRTYHRLACAIEDAGFITHPFVAWVFATGFPKATRVKADGWEGFRYGTQSLKPAIEPIYIGQKPFSKGLNGTANVLQHGTGALNIGGCRVEGAQADDYGRSAANARGTKNAHDGFEGKSFKISERDGEYASPLGRWPANLVHDGSEEVLQSFAQFGERSSGSFNGNRESGKFGGVYGEFKGAKGERPYEGNSGSAARFFFSAKADADDRCDSKHPTVKPVALMRWLARLITPPGGTVLDPFAGSGTTGVACIREGFDAILIEREAEYVRDIRHRLDKLSGLDAPLFARAAE